MTECDITESDIIKYKEYLLDHFKSIKVYCDNVIKGHSSNVPVQRNNKINILLNENETYLSSIDEAEGALKSAIDEVEYLFENVKFQHSIDDKVSSLEKIAKDMVELRDYSQYISEKLDKLSIID